MSAPHAIQSALLRDHGRSAPVQRLEVPSGMAGTERTIEAMIRGALTCAGHYPTKRLANQIVADLPDQDYEAEARAIFDWVKETTRYTRDPIGTEWVQGPCWTAWVEGQGDCDDHAQLVAALALAAGHGAAYRAIAADARHPENMSHVYALIGVRDAEGPRWYAADTAFGDRLGWEPTRGVTAVRDWIIAAP